jgi:hypothetical protein
LDGNVARDRAGQIRQNCSPSIRIIANRRFYARTLSNQKVEATIACDRLNRMASLGVPISIGIK